MAGKLTNKWGKIWGPNREEMEKIVNESKTFCEVLSRLLLRSMQQNHRRLKERLDHDGINYSHLLKSQEEIDSTKVHFTLRMTENSTYSTGCLKRRLIKEKYLENKCAICGIGTKWKMKPLVLVLDHINGVSNDHRLHNLRLLCPNCNSQTDTFTGRNRLWYPGTNRNNTCLDCHKKIKGVAKRCKDCFHTSPLSHKRKVIRPTKEELEKMVWEEPVELIGKKYGVSGGAVHKWIKRYGIENPGRGYWAKKKAEENK